MFGRVGRAVADDHPPSAAVLRAFHPEVFADAMALGMGAAGVGSGGAIGRTADGRQVSALARAVDGTMRWGRRQQQRFVRLPPRVLVLVTDEGFVLHEWTFAQGRGREVATWAAGTYNAERITNFGELGVRIVVDNGKIAILTGPRGPQHRSVRMVIDSIVHAAAK